MQTRKLEHKQDSKIAYSINDLDISIRPMLMENDIYLEIDNCFVIFS